MLRSLNIIRRLSARARTEEYPTPEGRPQPTPNKIVGPTFQQWLYNKSGFNQYGLMRDDMLHETPVVTEALKRLPQDILDERNFRIVRAGYLCLRKDVLPKEEWMTLDKDVMYLQPIIKEVEKELEEKREWEKE